MDCNFEWQVGVETEAAGGCSRKKRCAPARVNGMHLESVRLELHTMKTMHGNFILSAEDHRLFTDTVEEIHKGKAKELSPLQQYVFLNTFLHTLYTTSRLSQIKIPCTYDWTDESSLTVGYVNGMNGSDCTNRLHVDTSYIHRSLCQSHVVTQTYSKLLALSLLLLCQLNNSVHVCVDVHNFLFSVL